MAKSDGALGTLAKKGRECAPRVDEFIDKIPGGVLTKGFRSTIKDWTRLFRSVGSEAASLAKRLPSKTPKQQQELIQGLESLIKREKFLDPKILSKPNFIQRFLYGGGLGIGRFSDLWKGSNMATRVLMGKTKFYLGFLDYLGVANFVGPDELNDALNMSDEEIISKMKNYEKTPQAQEYLQDDIPKTTEDSSDSDMKLGTQKVNPMAGFFDVLMKGPQAA